MSQAKNRPSDFQKLGELRGNRTIRDAIRRQQSESFYQFILSGKSSFSLALKQPKPRTNVQLLNHRGSVVAGSKQSATQLETIRKVLSPGTYYIRVQLQKKALAHKPTYQLMMSADRSISAQKRSRQNSARTVRELGLLSNFRAFNDSIGANNLSDRYRFNLSQVSNLQIVLGKLSTVANLSLIYDQNNNGQVDNGELVKAISGKRAKPATLTATLPGGHYWVEIKPAKPRLKTRYTLKLSTSTTNPSPLSPDPGNTAKTAYSLGVLPNGTVRDYIGRFDASDIYQFSLNRLSEFSATLTGASFVKLSLDANENGVIENNEIIVQGAATASSLSKTLSAGKYFLEVKPQPETASNLLSAYSLELSTSPIPSNLATDPGSDPASAYDLGTRSGSSGVFVAQDYIGSPDPIDYYRFKLNQTATLSANIVGKTKTAYMFLIHDANNNNVVDANETIGTSSGSSATLIPIYRSLKAGSYFLRVQNPNADDSTRYDLTVDIESSN